MSKVAVITGSGKRRLGYYIACKAATRGFSIAVHYKTSAKDAVETMTELKNLGAPEVRSYQADFADHLQVEKFADDVLKDFGRVDLLVNTASIWKKLPLLETEYAQIKENFDINLASGFLLSKKLGLQMTKQPEGGLIVNFGDWAVKRPYVNYSAYYASKGGIPTITSVFAKELAKLNPKVRVNCIEPGPVMIPDEVFEAEKEEIRERTLLKKLGVPENVAKTVFSLVDNDFITGTCLSLEGGRTIAD